MASFVFLECGIRVFVFEFVIFEPAVVFVFVFSDSEIKVFVFVFLETRTKVFVIVFDL